MKLPIPPAIQSTTFALPNLNLPGWGEPHQIGVRSDIQALDAQAADAHDALWERGNEWPKKPDTRNIVLAPTVELRPSLALHFVEPAAIHS
jgi:hypothetical protein